MLPFFKPKKGFQLAGSGGGGSGWSIDTSALANKTDLTAIILTGTTNTSGNVISAGTWFYLNGKPCIAKVDIASGATFTEGTNYEEKTVGSALTELNSNMTQAEYLSGGNSSTPVVCRRTLWYGGQGAIVLITGYLGDSSISRGLYVLSRTLSNPPTLNTDEVFFSGNASYKPAFSIDNGGHISISVHLQYWTAVVMYSINDTRL